MKIDHGIVIFWAVVITFFAVSIAMAQEYHGHPAQDVAIHEQFYSTWMQRDNRAMSCCHNEDCAPAESRFENGHWMARKVSEPDHEFTQIPDSKIERDRDSPDGRSHVCGRRYGAWAGKEMTVYCFIAGAGG